MLLEQAIDEVSAEFTRARSLHAPMNSAHEGYAILKEEVDELWDAIKRNEGRERILAEAKQVAAMAIRIMIDCDV